MQPKKDKICDHSKHPQKSKVVFPKVGVDVSVKPFEESKDLEKAKSPSENSVDNHDDSQVAQEVAQLDAQHKESVGSEDEENVWYNAEMIRDVSKGVKKKIVIVIVICSIFILLESVGAYYSHSIAIFTDVAHLFSDLIGFIFSWFSISMAQRAASLEYTYGFVRAEVLGALFSLVMIWGLTIWIFNEAILRLLKNDYQNLNPSIMLLTAVGALFVNLLMGYFLHDWGPDHGHGHGHSHGHSHSHGPSHGHSHNETHNKEHDHDHDHEHHKEGEEHDHEHKDNTPHIKLTPAKIEPKKSIKKTKKISQFQKTNEVQLDEEHTALITHNITNAEKDTEKETVPQKTEFVDTSKHTHPHLGQPPHREHPSFEHTHDHENEISIETRQKTSPKLKKPALKNMSIVRESENQNIRAAWVHILGDTIQTIGVILVAIIIYLYPEYKFLDPILSITFSILAVSLSISVFESIVQLLMDSAPAGIDMADFKKQLGDLKHVSEVHDLHIWLLSYGKPAMTVHLKVLHNPEVVLKKATLICRRSGIYHSTIQVEKQDDLNCDHNVHTKI